MHFLTFIFLFFLFILTIKPLIIIFDYSYTVLLFYILFKIMLLKMCEILFYNFNNYI